MKTPVFPARRPILVAALAALAALASLPAATQALLPPTVPNGTFTLGQQTGTYTRTAYELGGIYHTKVVYTRDRDGAVRTDETVVHAPLANHSFEIDLFHTNFGSTVPSEFHKTVSAPVNGLTTGTGTYQTADGDSGTLATLESAVAGVLTISETFTSAATGKVTQTLRTEQEAPDLITITTLTLLPDGTVRNGQIVRRGAGDAGDGQ